MPELKLDKEPAVNIGQTLYWLGIIHHKIGAPVKVLQVKKDGENWRIWVEPTCEAPGCVDRGSCGGWVPNRFSTTPPPPF
jgi:hypothetical protein